MPIDTETPNSPGWWFKRQLTELALRQDRYNRLDSYYRGDPPLPVGPSAWRSVFQSFAKTARANWASLIVEAPRERMQPVGFRTGGPDDQFGDIEADRIWRANNMPAVSKMVHRSKLALGCAYAIVGPVDPEIGAPLITGEDPRQVITEQAPRDRRRTLAGLKVFADDVAGADLAYLYLPGRVLRAERRRTSAEAAFDFGVGGWEFTSEELLPIATVPVIAFPNRADLFGRTMGEFEDVTDDIDRINLMLLQRLVVAVTQAFRQRAIKGDLEDTDTEGEPIDYSDVFRSDPGALWRLPAGVDLWESGGVDLTPLLESVKADVRDLAGTTRTPLFYMFPAEGGGSAEGAALQREGLIFKCHDRITETSDPWERTMATAFAFAGDDMRAVRSNVQVMWKPPERFSLAERYDAASKAQAAGVPWRTVMTDVLQFDPTQLAEMEAQRSADAFLAGAADAVAR